MLQVDFHAHFLRLCGDLGKGRCAHGYTQVLNSCTHAPSPLEAGHSHMLHIHARMHTPQHGNMHTCTHGKATESPPTPKQHVHKFAEPISVLDLGQFASHILRYFVSQLRSFQSCKTVDCCCCDCDCCCYRLPSCDCYCCYYRLHLRPSDFEDL